MIWDVWLSKTHTQLLELWKFIHGPYFPVTRRDAPCLNSGDEGSSSWRVAGIPCCIAEDEAITVKLLISLSFSRKGKTQCETQSATKSKELIRYS